MHEVEKSRYMYKREINTLISNYPFLILDGDCEIHQVLIYSPCSTHLSATIIASCNI